MTGAFDHPRMTSAHDPSWEHYTKAILELFADRSLELDLARAGHPAPWRGWACRGRADLCRADGLQLLWSGDGRTVESATDPGS